MKALFKPADADKIIISGADVNEATLISQFINKCNDGLSLKAESRYDFNNEIDGLVIKLVAKEPEKPEEEENKYLPFVDVFQRNDANRLFKIDFEVDNDGEYYIFNYDRELFFKLKDELEALGVQDVEMDSKFDIVGRNDTSGSIFGTIEIPAGLFRMINRDTGKTNIYSDAMVLELRG